MRRKERLVPTFSNIDPEVRGVDALHPLPLHLSIPIYLEQGIGKNSSSQQGRGRNRVPKPLEHLWNKAEHWNRPEGHPLGDKPQGGGVEQIAPRGRFAPMSPDQRQDGQEQVVVESNSGRRYFVPRETVERLFRLCPSQAAALVARVSTLREPLEPPGCPSEAFLDRALACQRNPLFLQKGHAFFLRGVGRRDAQGGS